MLLCCVLCDVPASMPATSVPLSPPHQNSSCRKGSSCSGSRTPGSVSSSCFVLFVLLALLVILLLAFLAILLLKLRLGTHRSWLTFSTKMSRNLSTSFQANQLPPRVICPNKTVVASATSLMTAIRARGVFGAEPTGRRGRAPHSMAWWSSARNGRWRPWRVASGRGRGGPASTSAAGAAEGRGFG